MGKKPIISVTDENERISIKKQLILLKMCVMSFLCGPRADLWPFYGFLHTTLYTLYYTSRGDRPPDFENYSAGPDERNSSLSTFSRNKQVCDSHLLGTGTSLFYAESQGNSPRESTQGSFRTFLSFIKQMAKLSMLGHFRVALSLCFKARL